MNAKKTSKDVKEFLECFADIDQFVKQFEAGQLSANEVLKDIPTAVRAMLISAFLVDEFYKDLADEATQEDVTKVTFIVQRLEPFGAKIIKGSRGLFDKAEQKRVRRLEGEVSSLMLKPLYNLSKKRNQIRLILLSEEDKLMDTTMDLEMCMAVAVDLLNGVDNVLELADQSEPKLLPKGDVLNPYKKELQRNIEVTNRIASRLQIELETVEPEEKAEKPS